jgi:hypothetical protein
MSSLWTDLLFLHGHITDPRLARRLLSPAPPSELDPPTTRPAATSMPPFLQRLTRRLGSAR